MNRFDSHILSTELNRRKLLLGAGVLTGFAIASQFPRRVIAQPKFSDYPFSLGVASGDPLPTSVVLWTRLAPDPLNGGGMSPNPVQVQWLVAEDENMKRIVKRGSAIALPELAPECPY